MKETGLDMIEEAIFIIRPDAKISSGFGLGDDIVKQANMILDSGENRLFASGTENGNLSKKRGIHWKSFFFGALTVSAVFAFCAFMI